ncbi:glycoside hydrolase family 6 protein [Microbacterium sp. LRZ72]|uniref:glycoside hydrolase family 6 protein n=1 Tax=Microbacterium sp. LRZ72 TaxID=2942481 RepID=UPI0029A181F9|nr:glycoside hydrolase family 6 protein [Microbacterium sp. LRZ72]MDX2377997.1 glycoside hydrolase family 6 protein [Microbacterium sp. LRZ72]
MTPRRSRPARTRRPRRLRALWWTLAAVAVVVIAVVAARAAVSLTHEIAAEPPEVGVDVMVPAESKAAKAAAEGDPASVEHEAAAFLAQQPAAYWLTPEQDPIGQVGDRMRTLLDESRAQDAAASIVVYGLPERDCGNFSAGGLSPDQYEIWVDEIAGAVHAAPDVQKVIVIEPDSLALAPECGNFEQRVPELRMVVDRLASTNTWLYLDGGHSAWVPAGEMAELIRQLDVLEKVRGFATNVSNYQTDADEFTYARTLSGLLDGAHAVIDTSRNGAGTNGEWCNPSGRLIGAAPGTYGDDVVDTNLWIKPPGESDGTCNGGPAAGEWWPDAAVELTREAHP